MKKFLAAFDGLKFSESTLSYALKLAKLEDAHLFGIFLEDPYQHGYGMDDLLHKPTGSLSQIKKQLDRRDSKTRAIAIRHFEQACTQAEVEATVRKQHRVALDELVAESAYADLLVISSHEALQRHRQKEPVEFIHSLLPEVKCPVLIVPSEPGDFVKNIILYDGRDSSIRALRTFSQVLSSMGSVSTALVTVYPSRASARLKNTSHLKEYLRLHFGKSEMVSLEGNAGKVLVEYLGKEEKGTLVVMGAYQRNRISRWLKPSLADKMMGGLELPLFISHL